MSSANVWPSESIADPGSPSAHGTFVKATNNTSAATALAVGDLVALVLTSDTTNPWSSAIDTDEALAGQDGTVYGVAMEAVAASAEGWFCVRGKCELKCDGAVNSLTAGEELVSNDLGSDVGDAGAGARLAITTTGLDASKKRKVIAYSHDAGNTATTYTVQFNGVEGFGVVDK